MSVLTELGPWSWLVLAVILLGLEIVAPGIYLMWFGAAAAVTGVIAFSTDLGWQWQLVTFGVLSLAAVFAANRWLKSNPLQSDHPLLNRRAEKLVGRSYVLAEAIVDGRGRLKVEDTLWSAEGPDCPKGARVTVVAARGTVLDVTPEAG